MSISPDNLSEFLADAKGDGEAEAGSITLHRSKALQKLCSYLFEQPEAWVVKLVQAAVSGGADDVDFKFSRKRVEFRCQPNGNWNVEEILRRIQEVDLPRESWKRHLVLGLIGALGPDQGNSVAFSFGGTRVSTPGSLDWDVSNVDNLDDATFRLTVERSGRQKYNLLDRAALPVRYLGQENAFEFKALIDHCATCPIPVVIDSLDFTQPMCGVAGHKLLKVENYDSEKSDGMQVWLCCEALALSTRRASLRHSPRCLTLAKNNETQLSKRKAELHSQAVLMIGRFKQRVTTVFLMKDGALVDTRPFSDVFRGQLTDLTERAFSEDTWKSHLTTVKAREISSLDAQPFNFCLFLEVDDSEVDFASVGCGDVEIDPKDEVYLAILGELIKASTKTAELADLRTDHQAFLPFKHALRKWSVGSVIGAGFASMFIPHAIVIGAVVGAGYIPYKYFWQEKARAKKARRLSLLLSEQKALLEKLNSP